MEFGIAELYQLVTGSIAVLMIFFRLMLCIPSSWLTATRRFFLAHLFYARLGRRLRYIYSEPLSYLIVQSLYFAGTVAVNIFRVHSVSEASSRAAWLSLVNLIPLYIFGHEFGARLLGLSLRAYGSLHRTMGLMSALQAVAHVILTLRFSRNSNDRHDFLYGLLVSYLLWVFRSGVQITFVGDHHVLTPLGSSHLEVGSLRDLRQDAQRHCALSTLRNLATHQKYR